MIKFNPKKRKRAELQRDSSQRGHEPVNRYQTSNLVLSEFRCSLPMSKSSKSSVRRLASGSQDIDDNKIYQEISCASGFGVHGSSPISASFASECLAACAREQQKDDRDNDAEMLKEDMDGQAVLALYAKVDFVQKRKKRLKQFDAQPRSDKEREASSSAAKKCGQELVVVDVEKHPPTPIDTKETKDVQPPPRPSEPYVVIDNAVYSGHPAARRPSARF